MAHLRDVCLGCEGEKETGERERERERERRGETMLHYGNCIRRAI